MSKQTERNRLTKITSDLMLGIHDLVNWGVDTDNLTLEDLRMIVQKRDPRIRREAATKLIESGMSQRQAAKVLGVNEGTIRNDVRNNSAKSAEKSRTGSAKTKAHRAKMAAKADGAIVAEPTEKYRILYADPPWDYGAHAQPDYQTEQRDHYPVMELQAICDLQVEKWVEGDAVLFLWVTSPILEKAFQVVHAWGFEYKATFVWDKIKHNMGHYNSVRHEFLLICTRGACQPDVKQLFDSVQGIERSDKHSQKPVEFYDIIETLYTHGRRLELFHRGDAREGWDCWGLESEAMREAAE